MIDRKNRHGDAQNRTQNKKVVLTVSLLVSNSRGTIEKCMESIVPLLKSVPSECIVVDTGGTDGAIAVARAYADKVVEFTWCDDFSAARNAGMRAAQGEWFLFLDDDEWFENVDEIVQFFQSGEYQKFASACYVQRNYENLEGSKYSDISVERLCRRTNATHFTSSIHEWIDGVDGDIAYFKSFVHHYGYIAVPEARQIRYERNIPLLEQEIKKAPDDLRLRVQMAQEYGAAKKPLEAAQACWQGLAVPAATIPSINTGWLSSFLIRFLFEGGQYEQAWREGELIIKEGRQSTLALAATAAYMLRVCPKLKIPPKEALEYALLFQQYTKDMEDNPKRTQQEEILSLTQDEVELQHGLVLQMAFTFCCADNDFSQIGVFIDWLQDKELLSDLLSFYEQCKKYYPESALGLMEVLSQTEDADPYFVLQRLLVAQAKDNTRLYKKRLDEFMQDKQALLLYAGDFILQCVKLHKEDAVHEIAKFLDSEAWDFAMQSTYQRMGQAGLIRLIDTLSEEKIGNKIHYISIIVILQKYLLFYQAQTRQQIQENVMHAFCRNGRNYYSLIYKEALLEGEKAKNLPQICRFVRLMDEALEHRAAKKHALSIKVMKTALEQCPSMAILIKCFLAQIEEDSAKEHQGKSEMLRLGEEIKKEIRKLLTAGRGREALEILKRLEALLPGDTEVKDMKEEAQDMF